MENILRMGKFRDKVLVVEDEFINREILGHILEGSYDVTLAENGREAIEIVAKNKVPFSLILLDLLMPDMDGFKFLEETKDDEKIKNIPIIVMTSDESAEVDCIKHGAVDFITKPYMPEVILARCERIIELYKNKSIIRSAEKDELTGLYSKDFFFEYIRQIESREEQKPMDAVVVNIEHFHMINEMYGRDVGDEILKLVGTKLPDAFITSVAKEDATYCPVVLGCRPDSDVFYLYSEHNGEYGELFGELQDEIIRLAPVPHVRLRVGIYHNVDKSESVESRFDHAKLACDKIRDDFTKQIEIYSKEQNESDLYHERLISDMEEAIENKDFVVYFQPKYNIQKGDKPVLSSAEALIRWNHRELGMISPGDFIPLFESNGLVQKLDYYVWCGAAEAIKLWRDKYGVTVPVSVNVSRVDVYDPELENKLLDILDRNGLTPADMMLEITESAYSDDSTGLAETVRSLQSKGFKIEMDDFGSGYSALNTITTLPFDILKMDMKFVRNINKDEKSLKLVELVMEIARFMNVPVVAEGVEDEDQLTKLKDMGCEVIQGFYFSRPVPEADFRAFIEKEIN